MCDDEVHRTTTTNNNNLSFGIADTKKSRALQSHGAIEMHAHGTHICAVFPRNVTVEFSTNTISVRCVLLLCVCASCSRTECAEGNIQNW